MDKLKRYIDIEVPVSTCNLRCHYCYITQNSLFSSRIEPLKYSIEHITRALSKKRLGGICLLNLCGSGETLLPPYITNLTEALLEEGHYLTIVTNGLATRRIREIMEQCTPDMKKRLMFKVSFHYLELVRLGLMDKFFNNIRIIREGGSSFTLELTPSDELIPHIPDIKRKCMDNVGALCHVTIARDQHTSDFPILTKLTREEYKSIWSQFDSQLFDFKIAIFGDKRPEFCFNGLWGGVLHLNSGELRACYNSYIHHNILADPDRPIGFRPIGRCCFAHCFNAHSWLTLGMIPELATPSYADMRDRIDTDGCHWLQPEMSEFMSQKLTDAHSGLTRTEKEWLIKRNLLRKYYFISRAIVSDFRHSIFKK